MRIAHQDLGLLKHDDIAFGVSLGFDFCAEHEYGITGLQQKLGVGTLADIGISKRLAVPVSPRTPGVIFWERTKATKTIPVETRLVVDVPRYGCNNDEDWKSPKPSNNGCPPLPWRDQRLTASWDDSSFCIRAFGEEERQVVRDLHQAMLAGELLVSIGGRGSNPFSRGGLNLTILSRIPKEMSDGVLQADLDHQALHAAAKATRVEEVLKKADRRWFALSPAWVSEKAQHSTAHTVHFWLNPMDQRANQAGWYTVEQLVEWAQGKGPVLKQKA